MESSGSNPDPTRDEIRSLFSRFDDPCMPVSVADVAAQIDRPKGETQQALDALADRGEVQTTQLADGTQVWWRPADRVDATAGRSELQEFGAFVSAVEDYAIFMLDPDGTVASWNEGAARIKGYAEDEIAGEHFSTFYTESARDDGVPEENLDAAREQGHVEDEGWRIREDGSRFWADVVITAIHDADGTLQGFTKVTREKTEQREYEQQLRRERDLVEQILETVPVSIYTVDADGRFVRANQRALERINCTEAELSEHDIESWDIYDEAGNPIPMDEWPWKTAAETGDPIRDFQCQSDLPAIGRRWLSINVAPLGDGPHDDDRFVVSVEDITDEKEREQQLRRESEQTKKLLQTAPVGIAVQNADAIRRDEQHYRTVDRRPRRRRR
ncbi:PAS domain-containing protein [Halosimplex sp. J119]